METLFSANYMHLVVSFRYTVSATPDVENQEQLKTRKEVFQKRREFNVAIGSEPLMGRQVLVKWLRKQHI